MNAMEYNKISYEIVAVNDKLGSHYEVAILPFYVQTTSRPASVIGIEKEKFL